MIDNLNQDFTEIEEFPVHSDYQGNWQGYALAMMNGLKQLPIMSTEMISTISKLETMITQINTDINDINALSELIRGLSNYQGIWTSTFNDNNGYSVGMSVKDGTTYFISNIDNNTDATTSPNWEKLFDLNDFYTKEEVDAELTTLNSAIENNRTSYATIYKFS